MTIFDAIILGIVEGITEFLPVSSTGHLILVSKLLGIVPNEFTTSFNIIIQLGAILAVVVLYAKTVLSNTELIKKAIAAFIPTALLGAVLYKIVKSLLTSPSVVAWALIIGGILIIVFEKWQRRGADNVQPQTVEPTSTATESLSYKQAGLVGVFQSIAFIPGVSRSAATIIGGQLLGLSRKAIVEFSFILAVPTMLAASALDIYKEADTFTASNLGMLAIGFVVSFVVAYIAIKSFLSFIQKHSFVSFGIYRIIVGLLFLALLYL